MRGNYCLLHLCPLVHQTLSVRAVPPQEQLCLFDAGIVRKPGIMLDFWTELPVHQQIVLNAKSFLELGICPFPFQFYTASFRRHGTQMMGGLASFSEVESFDTATSVSFRAQPERKAACLTLVLSLEPGGKKK